MIQSGFDASGGLISLKRHQIRSSSTTTSATDSSAPEAAPTPAAPPPAAPAAPAAPDAAAGLDSNFDDLTIGGVHCSCFGVAAPAATAAAPAPGVFNR